MRNLQEAALRIATDGIWTPCPEKLDALVQYTMLALHYSHRIKRLVDFGQEWGEDITGEQLKGALQAQYVLVVNQAAQTIDQADAQIFYDFETLWGWCALYWDIEWIVGLSPKFNAAVNKTPDEVEMEIATKHAVMIQSWHRYGRKERMLEAVLMLLQTVPKEEAVDWLKICRDGKGMIARAIREHIVSLMKELRDKSSWAGLDEGSMKLLWRKILNLGDVDDIQAVFLGDVDTVQDEAQINRSNRLEDHLVGASPAPKEFIIDYYREADPGDGDDNDDNTGDESLGHLLIDVPQSDVSKMDLC